MFGSSSWELLLVALFALLLFGHRLPGAMRALGSSVREFRDGAKEGADSEGASPGSAPLLP